VNPLADSWAILLAVVVDFDIRSNGYRTLGQTKTKVT